MTEAAQVSDPCLGGSGSGRKGLLEVARVSQDSAVWDRPVAGILILASISLALAVRLDPNRGNISPHGDGGVEAERLVQVEVTGPSPAEGFHEVPAGTDLGAFLKGLGITDACGPPGSPVPETILGDLESLTLEKKGSCWEIRVGDVSAGRAFLLGRAMDISAAGIWDLTLLPGIGPATARKIVEDRMTRGPFRSVRDLARVKGLSARVLAKIEPLVTVSSPGDLGEDEMSRKRTRGP